MQIFRVADKGTVVTSYRTYRLLADSTFEESFTKSIYFPNSKPGITGYKFLTPEKLNSRFGKPGAYGEEIWIRIPYAGNAK